MAEVVWIDRGAELAAMAAELAAVAELAIDTEFLRERTFFPRLCLLQIAAAERIWLIDTIALPDLAALTPILESPSVRKVLHAGRQDLEVLQLATGGLPAPIFDTQLAAACLDTRAQVAYADLVSIHLGVMLDKGQTRTDWSRRPLSTAQLEYAADDVRHLAALAAKLEQNLANRGRHHWVLEDCLAMTEIAQREQNPEEAWRRVKGILQLGPRPRAIARALAWRRELLARELDRPRSWILPDASLLEIAARGRFDSADSVRWQSPHLPISPAIAAALAATVAAAADASLSDLTPAMDARPTPQERLALQRLADALDRRAGELGVSPEVLATRAELKALLQGNRDQNVLRGWRAEQVGAQLLAALGELQARP